jgi:hypothetical protein
MPVPAVSPYNWERTRIIAHFAMAVPMSMVNTLSFEDKLKEILDNSDGDLIEDTIENDEYNGENEYHYHGGLIDDGENTPYVVTADTRDRDDPHRPRVSDFVVGQLKTAVKREKSSVPTGKFDFDDNLGVVLDIYEDYYETLQCEMRVL